jgi:hypothetical protein
VWLCPAEEITEGFMHVILVEAELAEDWRMGERTYWTKNKVRIKVWEVVE